MVPVLPVLLENSRLVLEFVKTAITAGLILVVETLQIVFHFVVMVNTLLALPVRHVLLDNMQLRQTPHPVV